MQEKTGVVTKVRGVICIHTEDGSKFLVWRGSFPGESIRLRIGDEVTFTVFPAKPGSRYPDIKLAENIRLTGFVRFVKQDGLGPRIERSRVRANNRGKYHIVGGSNV